MDLNENYSKSRKSIGWWKKARRKNRTSPNEGGAADR